MSPESYENEPKEWIDECLSCTIPPEHCHGYGQCSKRKVKPRKRSTYDLERDTLKMVHAGLGCNEIALKLGIYKYVLMLILDRMRDKGMLTVEEERRLFKKRK